MDLLRLIPVFRNASPSQASHHNLVLKVFAGKNAYTMPIITDGSADACIVPSDIQSWAVEQKPSAPFISRFINPIRKNAAAAALVGAFATTLGCGVYAHARWDLPKAAMSFTSPEARKEYLVSRFISGGIANHEEYMEERIDPILESGSTQAFLYGTFPGIPEPKLAVGTSALSASSVEKEFLLHGLTGDSEHLLRASRYAQKMDFEIHGRYSDFDNPAVGRFAPFLEHVPALQYPGKELQEAYERAKIAAAIALRQYDGGAFSASGGKVTISQEYYLAPMLAAAARSPDLEQILDPRAHFKGSSPAEEAVQKFDPISVAQFYTMLASTAAAERLIDEDGSTYYTADLGPAMSRSMEPDYAPGARGPGGKVIAYEHAELTLAQAMKLSALEEVLFGTTPSGRERQHELRQELGSGYARYMEDLESNARVIAQRTDAAISYALERMEGGALPSYLHLPEGTAVTRYDGSLPNTPVLIYPDASATAELAYAMHLRGKDTSAVFDRLLDMGAESSSPTFLRSSKGYQEGWEYGYVVKGDVSMLKLVLARR